ncbi:3-phosphoshikimate 1-carboxyvinyltransferase [Putridiphycobacter roseus]|uniref:3-phosphoshikimate 1-carboxyvinyltransferase n=1 Tax=Putridiphycobacter roseus TaxID=2219161 RepID=A0A2W1MWY0_9FLAO|nr:3-phosphoshikimate 1-carboxyvinyltransferase [Putridiphycobacter roseus]PZE15660.1 3-phosphoshikimate 1-carboxyvinyltransferase [Putridiphycobacter roseus]
MKKLINPSKYSGSLKASPSKSFMQRTIAIALLADGETILTNPDSSNDSKSALKMAENLGAKVTRMEDKIIIQGTTGIKHNELSAGESGLGIRCFIPISSLFSDEIKFSGEGSLKSRPLTMIEAPLKALGVKVNTNDGYLPVTIQGPIKGGDIEVDGSISSQVLTGLLIALPKAKNNSILSVFDLQSIPYIDMTLQIIKDFGVNITNNEYKKFHIEGKQSYKGREYEIEGDWSGAAFHLVGGAISGSIEVSGIKISSTQADRVIIDALKLAGADVVCLSDSIKITKNKLEAFRFDATHCPDLFPPLSNLAVACSGTTVIKGISRLVHKESNRALVLKKVWGELGIKIELIGDEMHIEGGKINGGKIDSHNDHRIAMMGAIAALNTENSIEITNAQAINKSYPAFFTDFKKVNKKHKL